MITETRNHLPVSISQHDDGVFTAEFTNDPTIFGEGKSIAAACAEADEAFAFYVKKAQRQNDYENDPFSCER